MKAIANRGGKDGLNLIISIIAMSSMMAIINRFLLAGRDEEEDRSYYDDLSRWERDTNMIIFLPGSEKRLKIPLPWGYSLFWAMGQRAGDMFTGTAGPIESARSLAANMDNQLNPWGGGTLPLPTFMDPIYHASVNKKFYGAPIQKEDFPFDAPTPAAYKSLPQTNSFYVKLSQFMNSALGGDSVTPGSMRNFMNKTGLTDRAKLESKSEDDVEWVLSGSMMEHFAHGYFAGPVKLMERLAGGVGSLVTGDVSVPKGKDIPVLRRFYASEVSDWMTSSRFYELRDRVLIANEYVKNLKNNYSSEKARNGLQANSKLLVAKNFVDAADMARKAIRRMEAGLRKNNKLSSEEKRHRMEDLRQKRIQATRRALAKAIQLGLDV